MTVIASEVERFDRLSATWWNRNGPMRPLHVTNSLQLEYISRLMARHFRLKSEHELDGLRVLDVGCGGGLLAEPLAARGAQVLGIDASPGNIASAAGAAGFAVAEQRGMRYLPVLHRASWTRDTAVNYITAFAGTGSLVAQVSA